MAISAQLRAQVEEWMVGDPDPAAREELQALLDAGTDAAAADIADRFAGSLQFGTAGLRGRLGSGPNRMNRAVVIRAAAGLCAYLRDVVGPGFRVVIGYDARYGSADFARDTAAVAVAAGGEASLIYMALPTPVTAFALRHLSADAAVMVTASHNPPQDNGYKVYLGGRAVTDAGQGAQIVPPADAEIMAQITAAPAAADVPRAESGWETLGPELREAYLQQVVSLVGPAAALPPEVAAARAGLRIVLTSMHGVGGDVTAEALARAGFTDVHLVAEQHAPDPDFPTVAFPNPEEPGALDLSLALAKKVGADLIIANDPDADRCSAAALLGGEMRQLAGDQVGWLLGERLAARAAGKGRLASSIVSSRLLGKIAAAHGLDWRPTLTGFKWISRVEGLIFGYEEALGYCVDPAHVRDKDGISAGLMLADYAAELKAAGRGLADVLDDLALTHGLYVTSPLTVRVEDLSIISNAMARLRQKAPESLAGSAVVELRDLSQPGSDLPPTDAILLRTAEDSRVVIRPSGTEPKLKCYLEVVLPVSERAELPAARAAAAQRLEAIKADLRPALGLE